MPASDINDTYCDSEANTAECGWDGGDCCECTYQGSGRYECYTWNYDCRDPGAQLLFAATGCTTVSTQKKTEASPCTQDVQTEWAVNGTASATSLANATSCSERKFNVKWMGHVNAIRTIYVFDGTSLNITGISDAVMDGGGKVQILLVSNRQLYLKNMEIVNGNGSEGGAIFVGSGSELFIEGASFSSNTAQTMGSAVYVESSNVTLVSTAFDGNSAVYGGAIVVANSTLTESGYTTFMSNKVTGNGGALLIAGSSYLINSWKRRPTTTT